MAKADKQLLPSEDPQSLEREQIMRDVLCLEKGDGGRTGPDSRLVLPDGMVIIIQQKSTLNHKQWVTTRDCSRDTLETWCTQHYVYAYFRAIQRGKKFIYEILEMFYVPPVNMPRLLETQFRKIAAREAVDATVRGLIANSEHDHPQFWKEFESYSTRAVKLNNDPLPRWRVLENSYVIEEPYADNLRNLIMKYGVENGRSIQGNPSLYSTDKETLPFD